MNIAVVGVGYVGLVTGAVFAELGNVVVCVDNVQEKIDMLNRLEMPFYEPGLEEIVANNFEDGRLAFSTDLADAVRGAEIIFIAVGTPPKDNGQTDLSYVKAVAEAIGGNVNEYKIVVNKSTVPVGTGDLVKDIIDRHKPVDVGVDVVSNPEFLSEGTAIADALSPDRIVIGAPNKQVAMKLVELYSTLEKPTVVTSVKSAEMIKYASNAFLATKISFVNSIANLCDKVGADIEEVTRAVGLDERIGSRFMRAGIGFGGSCFPKDTESLLYVSREYGSEIEILKETIKVNRKQPLTLVAKMEKALGGLEGKTIAALGLSFKPGTDDLRDSSALVVIEKLLEAGATVRAYDPMAMQKCKPLYPDVTYCNDIFDAAKDADAVALLTDWNKFKHINFNKLKEVTSGDLFFDGRNIYNPEVVRRVGLRYFGIGRGCDG